MIDFQDPGPDYELIWPRELFVSEAKAVLHRQGDQSNETELLLREAFSSDTPMEDYRVSHSADPWASSVPARGFLETLVDNADRLPSRSAPRPYWRQRTGTVPDGQPTAESPGIRAEWSTMATELQQCGYLGNIAAQPCIDDRGGPDPDAVIASEIDRRAGGLHMVWPPSSWSPTWDDDEFWELIEIVHDLVARPRRAAYHDYGSCGWHYSHHSPGAGQAVYRWRVNKLLTRYGVALQLADCGEDRGRLVRVPSDERSELLQRAVSTSLAPAARDTVEHATALFRSRHATREDKRSACIALAAVLEERREQLKTALLSKDEGALFQIANQFAIRHRRADQQGDYDQAYLDWLFWWYLATVELTNRLLAREPAN